MTRPVRILGLDPGLRRTGWGVIACEGARIVHVAHGVIAPKDSLPFSERLLILFELLANGLRRLIYPHTVLPVRYGDRSVDPDMQRNVVLFIASFFVIWAIGTILLGGTGLDFVTATTGSLTALTNVGPGLGPIIGPVGNFSSLPDSAKWVLSFLMLLGRLEILAVLVLFTPTFWTR